MGIQVSSSRPQRYGEALVRSGIVGKIREVHTFSNKSWGDDKPMPEAADPVPAPLDWDEWLGVNTARPFKRTAYHPGEWRRRVGFGTGTLGDMGCHIYSPPYRALKLTSPVSVTAYGPSPTAESWATKARVKLTYPGTEYTAGKTVDVWWYDGGELPPDAVREPVGTRFPQQGSVVVGTEGLLVLPHGGEPFVLPESRMASMPKIELPGSGSLRRVHRRRPRRRKGEVFRELRLLRAAHRVRDHRQRGGALSRRDPRVRREGAAVPEEAGSQPIPDAQLPQRVERQDLIILITDP